MLGAFTAIPKEPEILMSLKNLLFGEPLATHEEGEQRVGPLAGIPMLGLDALASAAYGPEAAMTLLIPLGALSVGYIGPISIIIIALLFIVYLSRGARAFCKHRLRRLPAPMPGHCATRLSATRLRLSREATGLFAGDLCVDVPVRAIADYIRWRHRSSDSALCGRSLSRLHTFAGGNGRALAAGRRRAQSPQYAY